MTQCYKTKPHQKAGGTGMLGARAAFSGTLCCAELQSQAELMKRLLELEADPGRLQTLGTMMVALGETLSLSPSVRPLPSS